MHCGIPCSGARTSTPGMLSSSVLVEHWTYDLGVIKVPLFEQEVDAGLARSTRNRRNPARFRDYIPTSTVPTQIGRFLTKKQRLEAAKARADAAQPEHDPEPPSDEGAVEFGG